MVSIVACVGVFAVLVRMNDSSSALPPECTGTHLEASAVVQRLRAWDAFSPLLGFKVASSSIDTCDGSPEYERLELLFNVRIAEHTHQLPLILWIAAKDGVPQDSEYNTTAVRNLVESVSGITELVGTQPVIKSWLSVYNAAVGDIQPRTPAQPLCVTYVNTVAGERKVDRLWWCSDRGVLDYTIRRWDELKTPEVASLAKYMTQRYPEVVLHQAALDRFRGTWSARVHVHDGKTPASAPMELVLKAEGWRALE